MRSVRGVCATFFSPAAFGPLAAVASAIRVGRCAMACFAILAILTSHASAVVILNTDGSGTANNSHVSDPGNGVPYDNVGVKGTGYDSGSGSIVYLGNQWAITDTHVNVAVGGNVDIGGNTYTVNQTYLVLNSVANGSSQTDLEMIHLNTNPGIPGVTVAPVNLAPVHGLSGQGVTMIGNGQDLGFLQNGTINGEQYYSVLPATSPPRWGTNVVDPFSFPLTPAPLPLGRLDANNQPESAYTFTTTFNLSGANGPSATNQEATATSGDSGGGVFEQVGGLWYLVGLMEGNSPANNNTSIVNNSETTTIINLAYYQTTIAAVVPEPSSFVLAAVGAGMALLVGLRGRRKRLARSSWPLAGELL